MKRFDRLIALVLLLQSQFGRAIEMKSPALLYGRATEQAEAQVSSPRVSKGCASTQ
ncbi:MAG: hypothetical protein L0387_00970 [Acidobacteria bacterium]|nr:hypothetical protein [Acidobacteriota bacterium]MCI0620244.1 hypothetical protein [Acidobacteriota bacterium]MCI0722118.1 hypothetical protein [Acidobacteriota bacterium]